MEAFWQAIIYLVKRSLGCMQKHFCFELLILVSNNRVNFFIQTSCVLEANRYKKNEKNYSDFIRTMELIF